MHVYTLSDMQSEKILRVHTASEAKGLRRGKCSQVRIGNDILEGFEQ